MRSRYPGVNPPSPRQDLGHAAFRCCQSGACTFMMIASLHFAERGELPLAQWQSAAISWGETSSSSPSGNHIAAPGSFGWQSLDTGSGTWATA